jgi:hypothetical protein
MTRHTEIDISCPYCHDNLEHSDFVLCKRCETPHHEECFRLHKGCTQLGCQSRGAFRGRHLRPEKAATDDTQECLTSQLITLQIMESSIYGILVAAALSMLSPTNFQYLGG